MANEKESLGQYVLNLLNEGQGRDQIEQALQARGFEEHFVKSFVSEAIKLRNSRRRVQGLVLILGGAVICFLSFLLTITSTFTQGSFPYVLYGLTTAGIIVVFCGFMKIF